MADIALQASRDPTNPHSRKRHRAEDTNPRKRVRSQSPKGVSERKRSAQRNSKTGDSYRPTQGYPKRPQNHSWRHSDGPRENSSPQHEGLSINDPDSADPENTQKKNRKSRRDRKENPSSRIHSLRKLIERGTLPPPVQAEKERELSTLLYEREKKNLKQTSKRNLERYHFVRFMERQKAQRTLKQLQKLADAGSHTDRHGRDLTQRLKEAEIDLNYTLYAPLGEKYISLFAEQRKGEKVSKAEKYKGNWRLLKPAESKYITKDHLDILQKESMEAANVLEIFNNEPIEGGNGGNLEQPKPPTWYEVQAAMEQGQGKLEALRDRVRSSDKSGNLVLGLNPGKTGKEPDLGWLHDDGEIDPADMDVDAGDDVADVALRSNISRKRKKQGRPEDDDDEDDMSDGDGGFFERR